MTRLRNENGEFSGTDGPDHVFEAMEPDKTYTTREVYEELELDASQRSVYNWLSKLHDDDKIEKRKPNDRLVLWTRPSRTTSAESTV